jgi:hypothetical protein
MDDLENIRWRTWMADTLEPARHPFVDDLASFPVLRTSFVAPEPLHAPLARIFTFSRMPAVRILAQLAAALIE